MTKKKLIHVRVWCLFGAALSVLGSAEIWGQTQAPLFDEALAGSEIITASQQVPYPLAPPLDSAPAADSFETPDSFVEPASALRPSLTPQLDSPPNLALPAESESGPVADLPPTRERTTLKAFAVGCLACVAVLFSLQWLGFLRPSNSNESAEDDHDRPTTTRAGARDGRGSQSSGRGRRKRTANRCAQSSDSTAGRQNGFSPVPWQVPMQMPWQMPWPVPVPVPMTPPSPSAMISADYMAGFRSGFGSAIAGDALQQSRSEDRRAQDRAMGPPPERGPAATSDGGSVADASVAPNSPIRRRPPENSTAVRSSKPEIQLPAGSAGSTAKVPDRAELLQCILDYNRPISATMILDTDHDED